MSGIAAMLRRRELSPGMTGPDVLELQQMLNAAGLRRPLQPDGVFGARTQEALVAFQEQAGLEPDGVVRAGTWQRLRLASGRFVAPRRPAGLIPGALALTVDVDFEAETIARSGTEFPAQWGPSINLNNFESLVRPFHWRVTDSPAAVSAIWQVARSPFGSKLANWKTPKTLAASGAAGTRPSGADFATLSIDFAPILHPPGFALGVFRLFDPVAAAQPGARRLRLGADGGLAVAGKAVPHLDPRRLQTQGNGAATASRPTAGIRLAPQVLAGIGRSAEGQRGAGQVVWLPAAPAAPTGGKVTGRASGYSEGFLAALGDKIVPILTKLYVRLVLFNASGTAIAFSPVVIVDTAPQAPLQIDNPPRPEVKPLPPTVTTRIQRYEPESKGARPFAHFIVVRELPELLGFPSWKVGEHVVLSPASSEKDLWDQIGSVVEDAIDFVKDAVDWLATAFADAKAWVLTAVAGFLKELKIGCGEECRLILEAALNTGLAALGVPPSLPNFEEMVQMGRGYLVSYMATQVGVSPELAGDALAIAEKMVDSSVAASRQQMGDPPLIPDPAFLPHPPRLTIVTTNHTQQVQPDRLLTFTDHNRLFHDVAVPVPPLQPGQTLTIPLNLAYQLEGFTYTVFGKDTSWPQRLEQGYHFWPNFTGGFKGNGLVEFNAP